MKFLVTLLLIIAFSGPSFDVTAEICTETRALEQSVYCITNVAAEIAISDVWLEPVHDSTTWPSPECAQVERTACDDSTQDVPYFK